MEGMVSDISFQRWRNEKEVMKGEIIKGVFKKFKKYCKCKMKKKTIKFLKCV